MGLHCCLDWVSPDIQLAHFMFLMRIHGGCICGDMLAMAIQISLLSSLSQHVTGKLHSKVDRSHVTIYMLLHALSALRSLECRVLIDLSKLEACQHGRWFQKVMFILQALTVLEPHRSLAMLPSLISFVWF